MAINQCNCINPCNNCGGGTSTSPCTYSCGDDCLGVENIVRYKSDASAVGPCATTGTLDVSNYAHVTSACGATPVVWKVAAFDTDKFVSASFSNTILTYVTKGADTAGTYGNIIIKACCGELASFGYVTIGIKDLCNCPDCVDCDNCDPCTGDCVESLSNISISAIASTPTPTRTPTITPSVTQTSTSTPTPTRTPTVTPSVTKTPTSTPTPSVTPTISVTPSITPTVTPTPTITPTITITPTTTPTPTPSPA